MNLRKVWNEMTIPNKVNLIFVALLVPVLLFWSFSLLSSMKEINEINAEQIEECYFLECHATVYGGIECVEKPFQGDSEFQTEKPNFNMTQVPDEEK